MVIFEGVLILRFLVKLFVWALILRKFKKAKLNILRFQLYLKGLDLGYPNNFPIIQFFLNLHHGIVMSKYIICQSFKKFHRSFFSIAHPKYSNVGGILDARW